MGIDSGRLSTTIQPTSPFVRIQDSRASWRIDNGVPYMQSKPTVFTPADIFFLLQESGDFLLQETGGYLIR